MRGGQRDKRLACIGLFLDKLNVEWYKKSLRNRK